MSFDWSEYLKLAREILGQATTGATQEAKYRCVLVEHTMPLLSKRVTIYATKKDFQFHPEAQLMYMCERNLGLAAIQCVEA
ncbi:MAG: hypothetical protein AB4426_34865 [Xenococcaceae cyanobacterium]